MIQKRVAFAIIAVWLLVLVVYQNNSISMSIFNDKEKSQWQNYKNRTVQKLLKQIPHFNETEDYFINTPGCRIPNYSKRIKFKETKKATQTCSDRVVFVKKTSDDEIMLEIDHRKIKTCKGGNFTCCYKFATRKEENSLSYSECVPFKDGDRTLLQEEIITVSCNWITHKGGHKCRSYKDAYLILKKKDNNGEVNTTSSEKEKRKWNVLILGMDTMSRARAVHSLPKTTRYLREHKWLDYLGYNKIGLNTFPNLMAILTGQNSSTAYTKCTRIENCRDILMWSKFKEAGYMTAYGEDNLNLPDTFKHYDGFKDPPTDHYARPFFLLGEHQMGNTLCVQSKSSGEHLLEYSQQFAEAYKTDGFFGFFWINSYSHNLNYLPMLFEDALINFFGNLQRSGVLDNTFVIFLSDHGIRFGPIKYSKESYYEERLPMFFMWVPTRFQELHAEEFYNLQVNQHRLTTHYDLHATLNKFVQMSDSAVKIDPPEACPTCRSLTEEVSTQRTCTDASISEKWCSCHDLTQADSKDRAARSLDIAVSYIQNRSRSVKTKDCTACIPLKLKRVLRNDWYTSGNKTYYVVAFVCSPSDLSYEVTVGNNGNDYNIVLPTDTISGYNSRSSCVLKNGSRGFCVCTNILDNKCKKIL